MSKKKKNKGKKKPAVGSPAAGSNNKSVKTNQKATPDKQNSEKKQNETVEAILAEPAKDTEPVAPAKETVPEPQKEPQVEPIKQPTDESAKKHGPIKKQAVGLALVFAVVVLIVTCVLLSGNATLPQSVKDAAFKGRLEPDSVATATLLSPAQQKKLAKSVDAKGNTDAFDFYVNEEISIEEHTDPALIEFGSNETNECVLVVFLLDENGEIIYRSLGIEPGEEIRSAILFDSVSYGTQTATLVVNGYDSETYKKIGTQTVKIALKIGVDEVNE